MATVTQQEAGHDRGADRAGRRPVQVRLDEGLFLRLKLSSSKRRISMSDVVAEALDGALPAFPEVV